MKALNIDFAGQAGSGHRGGTRLWLVGSAILLLVACAAALLGSSLAREAEALRQRSEDIVQERDAVRSAVQHQEQLAPDVADSINGVIRMLDYPVIDLLEQLERHARPEIAVMSLEFGPVRSNFRLIVQAPGLPQTLDYLEGLQREPAFSKLALTRQEAGSEGEGWRFTLEMSQADAVSRALERTTGKGQE